MDLISREAIKKYISAPCTYVEGRRIFYEEDLDLMGSAFEGMTNGEVIQALFSDSYFLNNFPFEGSSMEKIYIDNKKDNKTHIMAQEDWWNAPYKAESEIKPNE